MSILHHAKRIYLSPLSEKLAISLENRGSSGVYALICKVNNKFYVGSSINLANRLLDYMQPAYLAQQTNRPILRAIVKYGIINFIYVVIETCHRTDTLQREQYWLDLLEPEYNLCKIAGTTQGVYLSEETKAKLRIALLGKSHTLETRQLMSETRKGSNAYWFGKNHSEETRAKLREVALSRTKLHRPGFSLYIYDQDLYLLRECRSHREGMRYLGCDSRTILRYLNKGLFKGLFYLKDQPL